MANGQENGILEASQEYSRMAELLKAEREPEAAAMVKQILESGDSLQDKIRKIELIDAQEIGKVIDEAPLSKEEVQEIIRNKHVSTDEVAQKNSEKIKIKQMRNPFFFYFFKDYKKIREFGKYSGFIRFGLNISGIKFNYNPVKSLFAGLKKDAGELINVLNFVLDKGWMDLDKLDYNLIIVFKRLCEALTAVKAPKSSYSLKQMLENYKEIETYFLTCQYQVEYPDIIRSSIIQVLEKQHRPAGLVELAEIQVRRILFQDDAPCLYNCILALNMSEYRRFIKIGDMIRNQQGGVINTFSFDCTALIQQKINVYINDKTKAWQNLLQEKAEIGKIQYFLKHFIRQDSSGYRSYSFTLLTDFYDFSFYEVKEESFSYDKNNTARLALKFFGKFMSEFENFFIDRIDIEGYGPVRVFSREVFQLEIDKLKRGLGKFSDASYTYPIISRREFFEQKTSKKEVMPPPPVLTLIQTADSLSDILVGIGTKLGNIHINQKKGPSANGSQSSLAPLEISVTRSHNVSIPYWSNRILSAGFLKDKFFSDAVATIASLCFLSAIYFYNMRLYSILEKEMKISNMIAETRKSLERLADVVTFEKIRKTQSI